MPALSPRHHPHNPSLPPAGVVVRLQPRDGLQADALEQSLRCVSSGYMSDRCSCPATIPLRVVTSALARQRARGEAPEEGLFRFTWQGELWLAFVQADGIRGVYCPVHLAGREADRYGRCTPLSPQPGLAPAA